MNGCSNQNNALKINGDQWTDVAIKTTHSTINGDQWTDVAIKTTQSKINGDHVVNKQSIKKKHIVV